MVCYSLLDSSGGRDSVVLDVLRAYTVRVAPDGSVESVDAPDTRFLHCGVDALMAAPFVESFPSHLQPGITKAIDRVRSGRGGAQREMRLPHADGAERVIEAHFRRDDSSVVVVMRDVTDRRETIMDLLGLAAGEQRRIGDDLHDGVCAHFAGVSMMVWGLASDARQGEPISAHDLEEVARLINEGVEQARDLARGLNPIHEEAQNLPRALKLLACQVNDRWRVSCTFEQIGDMPDLNVEEAAQLYRISQEALHNAARHAGAENIQIRMEGTEHHVSLTIRDDGVGISSEALQQGGSGLKIMQFRAFLIGATCTVSGVPDGTLVRIDLPAAADGHSA